MKIYDFTVKNRKGEDVSLENFKGKVLLIKNSKELKHMDMLKNLKV